jgi:hypothetical protein
MSGCVIVTGPPSAICRRNVGTTLPRLPSTFPKRTETYPLFRRSAASWTTCSATRLVAPITLVGRTALSVEMSTKCCTSYASHRFTTFCVPEHVVQHRLGDVRLHQRHVLVGRRVKDEVWAVQADHRLHARVIAHVGDDRTNRNSGNSRPAPGGARRSSSPHDRSRRSSSAPVGRAGDRARFRSTRRPGDHDDPVSHERRDLFEVRLDRLAPKQVLDLDLAERIDALLAGEDLVQARHGPRDEPRRARGANDLANRSTGRRGHRDHDVRRADRAGDPLQGAQVPEHGHVVEPQAVLSRVVVHHRDRDHAELRVLGQLANDHAASGAGADDDRAAEGVVPRDRAGAARRLAPRAAGARSAARSGHASRRMTAYDSRPASRTHCGETERAEHDVDESARPSTGDEHLEVGDARVSPQPAVQTQPQEQDELEGHRAQHEHRERESQIAGHGPSKRAENAITAASGRNNRSNAKKPDCAARTGELGAFSPQAFGFRHLPEGSTEQTAVAMRPQSIARQHSGERETSMSAGRWAQ